MDSVSITSNVVLKATESRAWGLNGGGPKDKSPIPEGSRTIARVSRSGEFNEPEPRPLVWVCREPDPEGGRGTDPLIKEASSKSLTD